MNSLTFYRIITFILAPIAALFAAIDFFMLFTALANPALLFVVFIIAGFVLYTFASLRFLVKHIDTNKPAKPSLKDWIRVNAYVTIFLGVSFFMNAMTVFFSSDASLNQILSQFLETQPTVPAMLTPALFISMMKTAAWILFFVSVLILAHLPISFRLLKQYKHLFENSPTS